MEVGTNEGEVVKIARFIGNQNKVLFQYESGTYASTSGAGQSIGLVMEHNPVDNTNVQQIRFAGGGNRNVAIFVDGALDHEGTITFHPQDWKFLAFAIGSNVDDGSPSPFTHTISEHESNAGNAFTSGTLNPFISFTIEDSKTAPGTGENFVRTLRGCTINTWELTGEEGEPLTVEVGYIAESNTFTSGATTAVTIATTRPFLWRDVKVHIPSGTVIQEVKSLTFNINNNLEAPHYLNGSREIAVPIPTNREYEVSLTLHATSERTKTLYDQFFLGGSSFNMLIDISDASAGAGSRDAFITLSGCELTEFESPSPGESEPNEQEITIIPQTASVLVEDLIELYNIF